MSNSPALSLQWSAQLTVVAPSHVQKLPGDKILLPPSALENLLSASANLARESARRDLPAYDPFNSATFSAYQRAEAEYQDQRQQLPHPLTFRLVNPENGRVVYAGVREFSAEEGEVVLSEWVKETLGLRSDVLADDVDKIDSVEQNGGLGKADGPSTVTVHMRELPKGTFVKLRPLEAGYDPEDWKALLEEYLRGNYTTLTKGEVLLVPGGKGVGGKREEFRFLIDSFKPDVDGICVVDTDLEVDIEALNEEQARETLERIAAKMAKAPGTTQGSSPGRDIDILKPQEGQILPGAYVDYRLSSWNRALPLELELLALDDDETLQILVNPLSPTQRSKPRMDEFVFSELNSRPKKRIRLEPRNIELRDAEAVFVSVHAYDRTGHVTNDHSSIGNVDANPIRYILTAIHPEPEATPEHEGTKETGIPPDENDVRCNNCHQWVPRRTLMLHENFCLRNNVLCTKGCGQVFQKRSPEFQSHWHCPHDSSYGNVIQSHTQHDSLFHPQEILRCSECSTAETFSNVPALAHHRTTTCPAKSILCRFCHLVVPQEGDPDVPNAEALLSGMTPHELADGARTTECHLCGKITRLRDMETHLRNHDLDRLVRLAPVPCRNINCGRTLDTCAKNGDTRAGTRMGQGPGNEIGLCSVCFGPLYVSMYDPENKALRRRIERRYLQQLLTGCGKSWCRNEFCKAGRKNLNISGSTTTKDALPMVKPFIDGLTHGMESPLHFCVDEASQKRRTLAGMLSAEEGGLTMKGGYDLEWCVGALEAEKGDLDGARAWLKNWAPARHERKR